MVRISQTSLSTEVCETQRDARALRTFENSGRCLVNKLSSSDASPTTTTEIANRRCTARTTATVVVQLNNVKAYVIRCDDETPYKEYRITKNATKRSRTFNEAYVEIVAGERFAVVVKLLPGFEFRSSSHVEVTVHIDGVLSLAWIFPKPKRGGTGSATFEHYTHAVDGEWTTSDLQFVDLQLDGDLKPTADKVARAVSEYGRITIDVVRGTWVPLKPQPQAEVKIENISTASKEVVKKNPISSALKSIVLEKAEHPLTKGDFVESVGKPAVRLDLLYRSRRALELLKVVPSLSLNPLPLSSAAGTRDRKATADMKQDYSDDDEELPSLAIKQEIDVENQALKAGPEFNDPQPHVQLGVKNEPTDDTFASNTSAPQTNPPLYSGADAHKAGPIVIKDEEEDDDIIFVSARSVSHTQPVPLVIKDEGRVPTRANPVGSQTRLRVSAAVDQHEGQGDRERDMALLKNRLEQLRIQQEQLKLEQELLEMGN